MRVLIINARYQGGGAERCARELLAGLPSVGVEAKMWVAHRGPNDPSTVGSLATPVENFLRSGAKRLYGWVQGWRRSRGDGDLPAVPAPGAGRQGLLSRLADWTSRSHLGSALKLGRLNPGVVDIVHLHAAYDRSLSLKSLHNLAQRLPLVWTLHDDWAITAGTLHDLGGHISSERVRRLLEDHRCSLRADSYHQDFISERARRFLQRWIPQPTTVVAPSQYMLDKAMRSGRFPSADFQHVSNGVAMLDRPEARMPRDEARRSLGLTDRCPLVLMVAADLRVPHKGTALGLAAFQSVARRFGARLMLLGQTSEEIVHGVDPPPVVIPYAGDDAALAHAYRAADLTLIPSLTENFPYVALESLACETPLAAFRVGGLVEIVGEGGGGLLAKPFDTAMLADCLERLLSDVDARHRLGAAGRAWVGEHCSMSKYLQSMMSVYSLAVDRFAGCSAPKPHLAGR